MSFRINQLACDISPMWSGFSGSPQFLMKHLTFSEVKTSL